MTHATSPKHFPMAKRLLLALLIALPSWLGLGACGADDPDAGLPPGPTESWVIGVYMAADNNLDPAAGVDLWELYTYGAPENVEVLVFIDRTEIGKYNRPPVPDMEEFSEGRLYRLRSGESWELLETYGEVNSTSEVVLNNFASRVANTVADRHAIVLWDHGAPTSYGSDETDRSGAFSMNRLSKAFQVDTDDPSKGFLHFDIVGFDTCLMSSMQVLETAGDFADILIASAELEPGDGWDYRAVLRGTRDENLTPELLAENIVTGYGAYYVDNDHRAGGLKVTLAAWHTNVAQFADDIAAFAADYEAASAAEPSKIFAASKQAVAKAHPYWANSDGRSRYVDMGDMMERFRTEPINDSLGAKANSLYAELLNLRIAYSATSSLPHTVGLSYTVDPKLIDPNSSRSLDIPALNRELTGAEGSTARMLANADVGAPEITLNVARSRWGSYVQWAYATWTASDDTALERVILVLGVADPDGGSALATVGAIETTADGLANATGENEIPMATLSLTDGTDPGPQDSGLWWYLDGRLRMLVQVSYDDRDLNGFLIMDETLQVQGLAVETEAGTWAAFAWDDVKSLRATIAPIQVRYDPVTGDVTETIGSAYPTANLAVIDTPVDNLDLRVVGIAQDVSEKRTTAVVGIDE